MDVIALTNLRDTLKDGDESILKPLTNKIFAFIFLCHVRLNPFCQRLKHVVRWRRCQPLCENLKNNGHQLRVFTRLGESSVRIGCTLLKGARTVLGSSRCRRQVSTGAAE